MKTHFFTLLTCIFLFSCTKSDRMLDEDTSLEDQSTYAFIKKLGYQDFEIVDLGDEYLVDGDILFAKHVQPSFSIFGEGPSTKQYGTSSYIGYNVQPNITVRVDPSMNAYINEINGAIALWNNVPNCRTKFTLTTSTNQHILITNANLVNNACGSAYFPVSGQPGQLIRININQIAGNSFAQRQRTIAHELGHTIGFRHTNWQSRGEPASGTLPDNGAKIDAMHILGTPTGNDVSSLMNGGQCGSGATALSNYDILAVQFLYPANPPVEGTVPVFRYYQGNTGQIKNIDHFFTTDINELNNGTNHYTFEGIGFFAFSNPQPGAVPIYRYYSSQDVNHYYTNVLGNFGGYVYEKLAFYAYLSSVNNSLPVHQYYNGTYGDHHYTKNQNESSMTAVGYVYEGIPFYAY